MPTPAGVAEVRDIVVHVRRSRSTTSGAAPVQGEVDAYITVRFRIAEAIEEWSTGGPHEQIAIQRGQPLSAQLEFLIRDVATDLANEAAASGYRVDGSTATAPIEWHWDPELIGDG